MQATRRGNDRIRTVNRISNSWHFGGWENTIFGENVGEVGPLVNRDSLYLIWAAFIPTVLQHGTLIPDRRLSQTAVFQ